MLLKIESQKNNDAQNFTEAQSYKIKFLTTAN